MTNLYIRIIRPEGYEDVHPDLILQDMNIDPVLGAEVVDVEAVLRECRVFLDHCWRDVQMNDYSFEILEETIAKIDEVLNEDR